MPFTVWAVLGILAMVFVPGVEVLAAVLMWGGLLVAAAMFWTDQMADLPAMLGLVALAAFIRFARLRVAARLW